ncbi:hypothetical protein, partial [Salmonella enterica]|uniref:hypothetical protein n=1 Tax=Salmonella enterica TaxID=28901 RepID=UPI001BB06FBB
SKEKYILLPERPDDAYSAPSFHTITIKFNWNHDIENYGFMSVIHISLFLVKSLQLHYLSP